jgi:hypothetical protein
VYQLIENYTCYFLSFYLSPKIKTVCHRPQDAEHHPQDVCPCKQFAEHRPQDAGNGTSAASLLASWDCGSLY